MKTLRALIVIAWVGLLGGCAASIPPTELIDARQAYQHATVGLAAVLMPAELSDAREALAAAERSFHEDPASARTRDLADIAEGKARMAEVLATSATRKAVTPIAKSDSQEALDAIKTRELIAGARQRAAALLERNSLPKSKEAGPATKRGGQTLKQPKPNSGQSPARESTRVAPAQNRQKPDPQSYRPGSMRIAKILLVDDGRNRSDSVRRILKSSDYQVFEAPDFDSGVALIGNRMFDLILLGSTLPGDSRTRIQKSLEQYQLTTRVIVIKEAPEFENAVRSATLAARGYFPTP